MSHVDFVPAFNASEQDDSEIQDILTSFYFTDREVKEEGDENLFNRGSISSEAADGCGEQEDADLYGLYGEDEKNDSSLEDSECSETNSDASHSHPNYPRNASAPHTARTLTAVRRVREDKRFQSALSGSGSQHSAAVKDLDQPEERRGRSRAVPMKLVRWSDSMRHNLIDKEENRDKLQHSRKEAPSEC